MRIGHPGTWKSKGLTRGIGSSTCSHPYVCSPNRERDGFVVFAQAFEVYPGDGILDGFLERHSRARLDIRSRTLRPRLGR